MSATRTRPRREYRVLLRRPGYPSFVLTVSLSRITGAMFMVSGVLLSVVSLLAIVVLAGHAPTGRCPRWPSSTASPGRSAPAAS